MNTVEIPQEIMEQAKRFGIDPVFLTRRILLKEGRRLAMAEKLFLGPSLEGEGKDAEA